MEAEKFSRHLEDSYRYLSHQQETCECLYHLSNYEVWEFTEDESNLRFKNGDYPDLEVSCAVVGSWNKNSRFWTWCWSIPFISERSAALLEPLRIYGEAMEVEALTVSNFESEEAGCWQLTSLAAHHLSAVGAYRIPFDEHLDLFVVFTNVKWIQDQHVSKVK